MTVANQSSTNYYFYLKVLAALTAGAAIAAGIYMNTAAPAATTQLATAVVVSTPSILPAVLIIGALLLLFAYLVSQTSSSSTPRSIFVDREINIVPRAHPSPYGYGFFSWWGSSSSPRVHTHRETAHGLPQNPHGHPSRTLQENTDRSSHGQGHRHTVVPAQGHPASSSHGHS